MANVVRDVFKDYEEKSNILDCIVDNINLFKRSKKVEIDLTSNNPISIEELDKFEEYIKNKFMVQKVVTHIKYDIKIEKIKEEEWGEIVKYLSTKYPITKHILDKSSIEVNNNNIVIKLLTPNADFLRSSEINENLNNLLANKYGHMYKIDYKEEIDGNISEKQARYLEEIQKTVCKQIVENIEENVGADATICPDKKQDTKKINQEETKPSLIIGKTPKNKDNPINIVDLNLDYDKVVIEGKVVATDFKELKIEKQLIIFDIYDGTSTITCKSFVEIAKAKNVLERIMQSKRLRVIGTIQYDNYSKDLTIMASNVMEIPDIQVDIRKDLAKEKRVELHLHTQMSQLDAVSSAYSLIKRANDWGMKAIAITDHGVVQAFPEAKKASDNLDIKVIYGVEAYLVPDKEDMGKDYKTLPSYHAIIFAKDYVGLKNLYKLISISHLEYFYRKPRILRSIFNKYSEGLIIGSACEQGEIYKAIIAGKSDEEIEEIAKGYDYLEIQPIGNNMFMVRQGDLESEEDLKDVNRKIVNLGEKLKKLVVATCDVHFLDPEDEIYRRILMAGQGYKDSDNQAPLYLRTTKEMLKEFDYLGEEKAYEIVVTNTNKIADMCEKISPISKEKCPPKIEGAEKEIEEISLNKAKELYGENLPKIVEERLYKELNSIIKNGFSTLYIIAQKLVQKSNEDGYLVGSRGSVGSSFVAFMLGITEVNSIQPHYRCHKCKHSDFKDYGVKNGVDLPDKKCPECGEKLIKDGMDIPFETFLGFDGDKEPDIDLNFSGEYQGTIHRYTEKLFGEGKTFKAGTVSTIANKTAFGYVKNYFDERNITVSRAELSRIVLGCVGVKKTTGQHPGGIIVVPHEREIYEFCPVQRPADDSNSNIVTTHFDYHSIDKNLLKLDLLGHDDPTMIRMLQDLTGIDPKTIPLDDKDTMKIFSSTKTLGVTPEQINSEVGSFGVPEFGTKFVRGMLVDTKPTTFEELIRISGLSHGTDVWVNNAQDLVNNGTATLSEAICTRDDIMTYLIKKGLPSKSAFDIMESVRKGKGLTEEQETLMKKNKVPTWYIESCKKIKYMFPKAHAVAYVTMAYRIAWFKVHHPVVYYTAFFSVRADDFDSELMIYGKEKVKSKLKEINMAGNGASVKDKSVYTILEIVLEMYERGIKFLPIDIYKSHSTKFLIEDGEIRPPLSSIPGLGGIAAENIQRAAKEEGGKFMSIEELQIKAKIGNSTVEMLAKSGCLEGMNKSNQISLFG